MWEPPFRYNLPTSRTYTKVRVPYVRLGLGWPWWAISEHRRRRRLVEAYRAMADALSTVVEGTGDLSLPIAEARRWIASAAPSDRRLWDLHESLASYDPSPARQTGSTDEEQFRAICRTALCRLDLHRYCTHAQ
jgi:hypothetical protein